MKKAILLFLLITLNIIVEAQTYDIDKVKKELKSHTRQDTLRGLLEEFPLIPAVSPYWLHGSPKFLL